MREAQELVDRLEQIKEHYSVELNYIDETKQCTIIVFEN